VTISGYVLQQTGAPQDFQIVLRKAIGVDDFSSNTTITAQPVFSIPDNVATYVEYTYTLGASDGTNGIEVNYSFPSLPAMTNAQFYFSELQLNTGANAKPFIYTPIGETLALCQRYYETNYTDGFAAGDIDTDGGCISMLYSVHQAASQPFKVKKRIVPTIVIYAPNTGTANAAFYTGNDLDTGIDVSATNNIGTGACEFIPYVSPALTKLESLWYRWTADAEL